MFGFFGFFFFFMQGLGELIFCNHDFQQNINICHLCILVIWLLTKILATVKLLRCELEFCKDTLKVSLTAIEIRPDFFVEIDNQILKVIWEDERLILDKTILKKKKS